MCEFTPSPHVHPTIDLVGLPVGAPLDFLAREEILMRRRCGCGVTITVSIPQFERALRLPHRGGRRLRPICLECAALVPGLGHVVDQLRQLIAMSLAAKAAAAKPNPSPEN